MHLIDNYLSELDIADFKFDESYLTVIDSPTGSGKTVLCFDMAKKNDTKKYIMSFPYVAQVNAHESKQGDNFQYLYNNIKFDKNGVDNIVCTYDQLIKLYHFY